MRTYELYNTHTIDTMIIYTYKVERGCFAEWMNEYCRRNLHGVKGSRVGHVSIGEYVETYTIA